MKETFDCGTCHTPVSIPPLIERISFPDDVAHIIDLLEGRFNVVICPVCLTRSSILVPVLAVNLEAKAVIIILREVAGDEEEALKKKAPAGFEVQTGRNYYDLYLLMRPWLNSYYLPIISALFTDSYSQLSRQGQIDLFTPLFLRIFKGQIDGKIDITIQFQGNASPEQINEILKNIYTVTVCDQLQRIALESARTKSLVKLPEIIEQRVPQSCITSEVLSSITQKCLPLRNPYEEPEQFTMGFRQEYLNAFVHAYANAGNPRGKAWANHLIAAWMLSKDERVVLDSQFEIPTETVRRTLKFEDLWDAAMVDLMNLAKDEQSYEDTLNKMFDLMEHYGYAPELEQAMGSGPLRIQAPAGADRKFNDRTLDVFKKTLFERYQLNRSKEESMQLGAVASGTAGHLLQNSLKEVAMRFIRDLLEQAIETGDKTAAVALVAYSVEQYNKHELYSEANALVDEVIDLVTEDMTYFEPSLMVRFWNEVGNVFRYGHHYDAAVEAYEMVGKLIRILPEDETSRKNLSTLNRNLGIAYRGTGKYGKALKLLGQEAAANPTVPELQHNIASVYLAIKRYREALKYLDRAIELARGDLNRFMRANYLISRGHVKQRLEDYDGGLQDMIEAFDLSPEVAFARRIRIASAVIRFHLQSGGDQEFVQRCKSFVVASIESKEYRRYPSLLLTMLVSLGDHLLREGDAKTADALIRPEWDRLRKQAVLPWEMDYVMGWLDYALADYEGCWRLMRSALKRFDEDVPTAEDVTFAPFWMSDKESFQANIASISLDLIERGVIPAKELVPVFEFMNGREISARIKSKAPHAAGYGDIYERHRKLANEKKRRVETFFFIETEDKIKLVNISSITGETKILDGLELNRQEVVVIKRQTRNALKWANPADLSSLDSQLRPWSELAEMLGSLVAPCLTEGSQVCFLPGRAFTGLPLHLATLPDGVPLIERHPVSYSPNFTTLLAEVGLDDRIEARHSSVVSVTKKYDPVDFKERAYGASESLVAVLKKIGEVRWLKEEEADREAITEALRSSSEILFICHGTTAGLEKGYGVCIADKGDLPPTLLPVSELPELSRFILTWQDIDDLDRSPETVVSVACSTGVTEISGGGVRYGLEQALFGSGTRIIISPLWDVEQTSVLAWLDRFYTGRSTHPDRTLEQAFQAACLELRERYPHPYFWGTFILNGSLL